MPWLMKVGEQSVNLPVLAIGDNRLLPETTQGWLLTSKEVEGLTLHAGHFTALRSRAMTSTSPGWVCRVSFRSADRGLNFNEVRVITEYPFNLF